MSEKITRYHLHWSNGMQVDPEGMYVKVNDLLKPGNYISVDGVEYQITKSEQRDHSLPVIENKL